MNIILQRLDLSIFDMHLKIDVKLQMCFPRNHVCEFVEKIIIEPINRAISKLYKNIQIYIKKQEVKLKRNSASVCCWVD